MLMILLTLEKYPRMSTSEKDAAYHGRPLLISFIQIGGAGGNNLEKWKKILFINDIKPLKAMKIK